MAFLGVQSRDGKADKVNLCFKWRFICDKYIAPGNNVGSMQSISVMNCIFIIGIRYAAYAYAAETAKRVIHAVFKPF